MDAETTSAWADMLKAVAHPVRILILVELQKGIKCVNDIRDLLQVPQPNVSQHLAVLKHCGLVAFRREGASRCYYLTKPALVKGLFTFLESAYSTITPEKGEGRSEMGEGRRDNGQASRPSPLPPLTSALSGTSSRSTG